MAFVDNFKGKQYKEELERLQAEIARLNSLLTPQMRNASNLQDYINNLQIQSANLNNQIYQRQQQIASLNQQIGYLNQQIAVRNSEIFKLDEEIRMQDFGLYRPRYDFATSGQYKDRLQYIREQQKQLVKQGQAVTGYSNWMVNGNISEGKRMVKDMQKLLLRAFNSECDELIDKVKYNNFDLANKRMVKSCEAISKLGRIMGVAITNQYFSLKREELCLALEYRQKKQMEKEEQKEIRARLREEAKLQEEIKEARKKIQKERTHYQNALNAIDNQLATANKANAEILLEKRQEIVNKLVDIDKSMKIIDYREANIRAGYVYVISNIGSFGENIYKIGMTRRLEPMDRIYELSVASVPFNFDVHAMIFSDDAPSLEAALHRAFESRKLNMVNTRREFFNVTLDEIEAEVKKNFDKTVEFTRFAPAEQYRESLKIKENIK